MLKRYTKLFFALIVVICTMGLTITQAVPSIIPSPPALNAKAYVLMDANSGNIIAQKNMDQKLAPASLTKLMTLYLTFQALQNGSIKLTDKVLTSKQAWQMGGSKMFIKVGTEVPVEDLIQGVIVDSGNDACVALSEFVGGSESSFVNMMNQQAQLLGMTNTHYADSTGLPKPDHVATAHDLALLTRAIIINFPDYYKYFNQKWFKYNNITQPNRNRLLWRFDGADGLKTGHTDDAGFCLISSALRNGMRLISVVMGTPTDETRASESIQLLTYGFRFFKTNLIYQAGNPITTQKVYFGSPGNVNIGVSQDLYVTQPNGQFNNITAKLQLPKKLQAPLNKNDSIGQISILREDQTLTTVPLVALNPIKKAGIIKRGIDHISNLFHGWFGSDTTIKTIPVNLSATPAALPTPAPVETPTTPAKTATATTSVAPTSAPTKP